MAELATIARPYANAVFDLAKSAGSLDAWSRMLAVLASTAEHETVSVLLSSPDLSPVAKAGKLGELCGDEIDDQAKPAEAEMKKALSSKVAKNKYVIRVIKRAFQELDVR